MSENLRKMALDEDTNGVIDIINKKIGILNKNRENAKEIPLLKKEVEEQTARRLLEYRTLVNRYTELLGEIDNTKPEEVGKLMENMREIRLRLSEFRNTEQLQEIDELDSKFNVFKTKNN